MLFNVRITTEDTHEVITDTVSAGVAVAEARARMSPATLIRQGEVSLHVERSTNSSDTVTLRPSVRGDELAAKVDELAFELEKVNEEAETLREDAERMGRDLFHANTAQLTYKKQISELHDCIERAAAREAQTIRERNQAATHRRILREALLNVLELVEDPNDDEMFQGAKIESYIQAALDATADNTTSSPNSNPK